jgi:hypothetical protein
MTIVFEQIPKIAAQRPSRASNACDPIACFDRLLSSGDTSWVLAEDVHA